MGGSFAFHSILSTAITVAVVLQLYLITRPLIFRKSK